MLVKLLNVGTIESAKMSGLQNSKFSWLFLPGSGGARARYDQVVTETANFVVLPSLGSIVPGWLLLIPKFPIARLADMEKHYHQEFNNTLFTAQKIVEAQFGTGQSGEFSRDMN